MAQVVEGYEARNDGELSLTTGDTVVLIGLHEDGWWAGSLNGRIGTFPQRCIGNDPGLMEKFLHSASKRTLLQEKQRKRQQALELRAKAKEKQLSFAQHRHRRRSRSVDIAALEHMTNYSEDERLALRSTLSGGGGGGSGGNASDGGSAVTPGVALGTSSGGSVGVGVIGSSVDDTDLLVHQKRQQLGDVEGRERESTTPPPELEENEEHEGGKIEREEEEVKEEKPALARQPSRRNMTISNPSAAAASVSDGNLRGVHHLVSPPRSPTLSFFNKPNFKLVDRPASLAEGVLYSAPNNPSSPEDEKTSQRRLVLNELLTTEQNYVRDLNVLISVFLFPLQATQIRPEEEVKLLFSDVEIIATVNRELLAKLEDRILNTPPNTFLSVGDIFLGMADVLKMYTNYCTNYPNAVNLLLLLENNREWQSFLAICQSDSKCHSLSLSNFLIKPVQRICKYPLLLRELMKHTDPSNPDYEMLKKATQKIEEVVDYINTKKLVSEMLQKALDIQSDVDGITEGELLTPSRRYVREGVLAMLLTGKTSTVTAVSSSSKPEDRQLFLFSDLLLVCKLKKHHDPLAIATTLKVVKRRNYELVGRIPLDLCRLIDVADAPPQVKHAFEFIVDGRTFRFYATTEEEKVSWLKELKTLVKEVNKRKIQEIKSNASTNPAADKNITPGQTVYPLLLTRTWIKEPGNIKETVPSSYCRTLRSLKDYLSEKLEKPIGDIEYFDPELEDFILARTDADVRIIAVLNKRHLRLSLAASATANNKQSDPSSATSPRDINNNQMTVRYLSTTGVSKLVVLLTTDTTGEELTAEEIQDIIHRLSSKPLSSIMT